MKERGKWWEGVLVRSVVPNFTGVRTAVQQAGLSSVISSGHQELTECSRTDSYQLAHRRLMYELE